MQQGIRTPKILQDKAQFAGNGCSIGKNCNAGLEDLGAFPSGEPRNSHLLRCHP